MAAEALKAPNQPDVVRAAYGIDPADPSNTGSERISSIIPALIADPKRTWDIRGAQITTARDLMTLVTVLRSPYVETAKIILLNRAGVVVHSEIVGIGSLTAAIMDSHQLIGNWIFRGIGSGRGLSNMSHNILESLTSGYTLISFPFRKRKDVIKQSAKLNLRNL